VLCDCAGTLVESIDFDKLTDNLSALPSVTSVRRCSMFCKQSDQTKSVKDHNKSSRQVIAACSLAENGINDSLCRTVNIREHCAWIHKNKKAATDAAFEMITAAVRRLNVSEPIGTITAQLCHDVAVIGSGVSGMQAAAVLAKLGHKVTLITKDSKLGGSAGKEPHLFSYLADDSETAASLVRDAVTALVEEITANKEITTCLGTSLKTVRGRLGDFTVVTKSEIGQKTYHAGAVVLATGTQCAPAPIAPELQNYGNCVDMPGLMTIIASRRIPKRIAIVMDSAGQQSRDQYGRVLSAAELLVKQYRSTVKLYCDNVRVAATGMESLYRRTRQGGLDIVKSQIPPSISQNNGKITIASTDPAAGLETSDDFDLVVIADKIASTSDRINSDIVENLRTGPAGALQYDNVWLIPTAANKDGIFIVGGSRGNSELRESFADGLAAANDIHAILAEKEIEMPDDAATVDPDKCVACLTCLRLCPHGAISFDNDRQCAAVSPVACRRCGICASQCPAVAIQLPAFTDNQITAEIGQSPQYTVFACENSAYQAATAAGINRIEYKDKVRLIRVPCAGKVDARQILAAFEAGADKVAVIGCHPQSCRSLTGASQAKNKIEYIQAVLEKAGFDKSRLLFGSMAAMEPNKFTEYMCNGYVKE